MRYLTLCTALAVAVCVASCGGSVDNAGSQAGTPIIKVLSNRADLISGGDVLVEIDPPPGTNPTALHESVAGKDVTSMFAVRPNGRYMGLVTGLAQGANVLTAAIANGTAASLTITNYPNGGPIIYGPQV
ncbi:MAG: DUF6351 family protein, partial [Paraburkholderia sp.]|uniref:DUF6351 family protein n=1 Tax=Paraburkholderia sp. TaxID=1926495 RepID=UPI003C481FC9